MAHLPHSIELHDSRLQAVVNGLGTVIVQLRPAYMHLDGKGWTQNADIRVGAAEVLEIDGTLPAKLADGRMSTDQGPYHNLLHLPLKTGGKVTLSLELVSGQNIRITGEGVEIVLRGAARYVEDFG